MSEFDNIQGFETPSAAPAGNEEAESRKIMSDIAKELVHKIETDTNYAAVRGSRSKDLRVTKVLGFGKSGSLTNKTQEVLERAVQAGTVKVLEADSTEVGMVDEKDGVLYGTVKKAKGNVKAQYEPPYKKGEELTTANGKPNLYRKVVTQPDNVGYIIENCSDKPIDYMTCVYSQDENGKYVGSDIKKTLAPGEKTAIARPYLTRLALGEEFNLNLANGKVICKIKSNKDAKDILESPYFSFDSTVGYDVNSPEVKELIHDIVDVNGTTKYVVKPEYVEVFGNLNNEAEKASAGKRGGKAKSEAIKPTSTEIAAYYLRQKLGIQ